MSAFLIFFQASHKDILCCAKAFYMNDIKNYDIISNGFDIDVELASYFTILNKRTKIHNYYLTIIGEPSSKAKLKISDGWSILSRIIK